MKQSAIAAAQRDGALREANRIHCRQTRERKRNQERQLREEVGLLQLCRSIVESGPDLFSVHGLHPNAPFWFICEGFCRKLQIEPEDILGQPLSSIVDPRDTAALQNVVLHVLGGGGGGGGEAPPVATNSNGAGGGGSSASSWASTDSTSIGPCFDGTAGAMHQQQPAVSDTPNDGGRRGGGECLVNVRVATSGLSCHAGMSIAIGSQGLIVVTRLYVP